MQHIPGRLLPVFFCFPLVSIEKAWTRPGWGEQTGSPRLRQAPQHPPVGSLGRPGRPGWAASLSELVPPILAAQICFYQMGRVPAAGPSRRWCKRCSLCAGGVTGCRLLSPFVFGRQTAVSWALCLLSSPGTVPAAEPAGIPSVSCSSWAGPHSPAQSRVSRCLLQREASQTWRASELSPVAQLGQPRAAGVVVPPQNECVWWKGSGLLCPVPSASCTPASWCTQETAWEQPWVQKLHSFHRHQFLPCRPPLPQGAGASSPGEAFRGLGAAAQPWSSCQGRNTSRVI